MGFRLNLGVLQVTIGADTSDLNRAEREVKRTSKGMTKSFLSLGKVIAATLSGVAIKNTLLLADKMNMLDQQIKNVVKNAKSFDKIRDGIRSIAAETGNSIESVTRLAQALIIAGESIGTTDEQTVEMISNLNKLGIIGGSSGDAMKNSMRQFGQAMAGGVVRAEEFNSIIENTPLIAKAIADGMEKTTGELRKAVIEGTVLSEEVFRSLQGQTDDINKKFAAMPMTIDRASGLISNAFATAIQDLDNGAGLTADIADNMADLADALGNDLVPFVDDIVDGFEDFLFLLDEATASTTDLANDTFDLAKSWGLITGWISKALTFIKEFPLILKDLSTILIAQADQVVIKLQSTVTQFSNFFAEGMTRAVATVKASFFNFIGDAKGLLAGLFDFVGAYDISNALEESADESKTIAQGITDNEAEQQLLRADIIDEEIIKIQELTETKLNASVIAQDAGLAETDDLRRQAAERTKIRQRERIARRKSGKETTDESVKIKKVLGKSLAEQLKDIKAYGQASDALAKAGIISDKHNALIQVGISAATAVAKTSELGFPQALPFIAMALANIANARQMLSGAGREFGGSATGGLPIPVNEGGPEMFVGNSGRQFLLPDQSGKIVPLGKGGGASGGGVKVIINNNAPGVEVTQTMSNGDILLAIEQAEQNAINAINSSLAAGRGDTAEALRSGFNQTRNI